MQILRSMFRVKFNTGTFTQGSVVRTLSLAFDDDDTHIMCCWAACTSGSGMGWGLVSKTTRTFGMYGQRYSKDNDGVGDGDSDGDDDENLL